MVRTPEAILRTSSLGAMHRILVAVISAIIVTVAEPIGFHADASLLAFQMIGRTGCVHGTSFVGLVRSDVVLAVVHAVADQILGDATVICTSKLAVGAGRIDAALLVAAIAAIVLMITFPRFKYTPAIITPEFIGTARVVRTVISILVRVIPAVIVAIASPHSGDTTTIAAGKFAGVAGDVLGHAHPVLVYQSTVVIAFAFDRPVHTWMTRLIATAIRNITRIYFTLLPGC